MSQNDQGAPCCVVSPFSLKIFPCSANHERDWSPCKVVFFGLTTNALNVRNNNNNNNNNNCQESAGTGPVNLKVVPNECCLGRSPWTN